MTSPQHYNTLLVTLCITVLLYSADCHINLVDQKAMMKQKLSHFRLYWHDILSGSSPSSLPVLKPVTKTGFGAVNMIDNPLTLGPELLWEKPNALASQEEIGLLMAINFFFTSGNYNGSSITILGRNSVMNDVREMPVIGGSGLFRFAPGYAQARTHD